MKVTLINSAIIQAIAIKSGYNNSDIVSREVIIEDKQEGVESTAENKIGGTISIKDGSSDNGNTSDVSIRFLIGDSQTAAAQIENHTYSISNLSDGIYTLEASKPDYATWRYPVTIVNGTDESIDIELHRIGDIDGDGNANMRDLNRICHHIRRKKLL